MRNASGNGYKRGMENSLTDSDFSMGNGTAQPHSANAGPYEIERTSADVAAELYFKDPVWRARFDARCENERAKARAEAEEMIREGQEKLAALTGDTHFSAPGMNGTTTVVAVTRTKGKVRKAVPRAKTVAKPKAPAAEKPRGNTNSTDALDHIKAAGKEGLGTVRLGKLLGTAPGPIVAPLIEAGKVKRKGEKRGTTYFAV